MSPEPRRPIDRRLILVAAVVTYFVAYPEDVSAILSPFDSILNLSNAVSPWLYVVLGAGVVAWALVRIFGRPQRPTWEGESSR